MSMRHEKGGLLVRWMLRALDDHSRVHSQYSRSFQPCKPLRYDLMGNSTSTPCSTTLGAEILLAQGYGTTSSPSKARGRLISRWPPMVLTV